MGALAVLMFLILLAKGADAAQPQPAAAPAPKPPAKPPASPPAASPPPYQAPPPMKPWPVAAPAPAAATPSPAGLPKFPSGWEPDVPPPAAVVRRANALLPTLWKSGKPGATATEQTEGRWITYQGYSPAKGKRGVVAYRMKAGGGTVYA